MNKYKAEIAKITPLKKKTSLSEALKGADVFIGVSGIKNLLNPKMIRSMNKDPIIFALTNPDPEINPIIAKKSGARIVATGSYKHKNKVNNALVFPYLMRAILDLRIKKISLPILYTTALAIANTLRKNKLNENNILPTLGDKKLQSRITNSLEKLSRK